MNIKTNLKKTQLGKIIQSRKRIVDARNYINKYKKKYIKNSSTDRTKSFSNYCRLRIIIINHTIEKGLSHKIYKVGFGKESIIELQNLLKIYENEKDCDKFAINKGKELLIAYHQRNKQYNYDDKDYVDYNRIKINEMNVNNIGYKKINIGDLFLDKDQDFYKNFIYRRVSVRSFDIKSFEISKEEINYCVELANMSPNACNRQATRVHFYNNPDILNLLEKIQKGCKGFGENAGMFALITSDLRLYENKESKLSVYDSGIFTMGFVNALHSKGIMSCVLNSAYIESEINNVSDKLQIPEYEQINGCVLLYKLPGELEIYVPESSRREGKDIYTIHTS